MLFQRLLLLFVAPTQEKGIEIGRYPVSELGQKCPAPLFRTTKWARVAVLRRIRTSPRGNERPIPVNQITSKCKIKFSQKYCPWMNFSLWDFCHSFVQWMGSFFLIIMFCSAIHVYTDRFADMGIIAIRPPLLRCEFHAELPFVLIFGHKQSCWTVLSELRYKVAYNPNTFFLNWEQRTVGKAVKDACTAASKNEWVLHYNSCQFRLWAGNCG